MTIHEALLKYRHVEIDLLLCHLLKIDKAKLYLKDKEKLTLSQEQKLIRQAQKRLRGVPIAYILGYKYFYGNKFKVNQNVLIPRPETEWLVWRTLKKIKHQNDLNILDIGTGSGCIIISLSKLAPDNNFFATDTSLKALKIARENSSIFNTKINFYQASLFPPIKRGYDVIIANLPYVPLSDYELHKKNLKYEPKGAITTGKNSWPVYEMLINKMNKFTHRKSLVLFEIDPKQKHMFLKLKKTRTDLKIMLYKDLKGLYRYCEIQFKKTS